MSARRWRLAAVLLLGAVIRLLVLGWPGTADVHYFQSWAQASVQFGPRALYPPFTAAIGKVERDRYLLPAMYPPGTVYYLAGVGAVYDAVPVQWRSDSLFNAVVKLPGMLLELIAAGLLFRHLERRRRDGVVGFAAIWLNPAILIAASCLGYQDSVTGGMCLIALLLALDERPIAACSVYVAALLTKQLALFLFPVLALFLWRCVSRRRALIAAAAAFATGAVMLAPFLEPPRLARLMLHLKEASLHNVLSANALNSWWLATAFILNWGPGPMQMHLIRIPAPWMSLVGRGAYVAFTLVNCWSLVRRPPTPRAFFLAAGMQFYGYAMLMVGVHENHLVYAAIMMAPLIVEGVELAALAIGVSLMVVANLVLFYGLRGSAEYRTLSHWATLTVVLAALDVALFVWATLLVVRGPRARPSPSNADRAQPSA